MNKPDKTVLIVCPYPKDMAPSQRLKYEQYLDFLSKNHYHFEIQPFVSVKFSKIVNKKGFIVKKFIFSLGSYFRRLSHLFRIRQFDIIYIHLWVTPIGWPVFEFLYCLFAKKIIYDIDDLIFLKSTKNSANRIVDVLKGRKKPLYLMKRADHVITCTPYLDSFVRKYNENTTDISSTVNTELYTPKTDYSLNNELLVIGWSGSHSTSKYLHLLDNVFHKLKERGLNYKLKVMGDENFAISGINYESIAWKRENEIDIIRGFDIGLYPLPDTQWVMGKSSLKAIQYMSVGVPTIASALSTTDRVIDHKINGYLVKTEDDWVDAILTLSKDEHLRKTIGANAVEKIEKHFSVNANKETYLAIFNNVSKRRG